MPSWEPKDRAGLGEHLQEQLSSSQAQGALVSLRSLDSLCGTFWKNFSSGVSPWVPGTKQAGLGLHPCRTQNCCFADPAWHQEQLQGLPRGAGMSRNKAQHSLEELEVWQLWGN